jgi:16S rRNA (cytosine1402-N4)-methyltransferase
MGTAAAGHYPVLLDRVLALLKPALESPGAVLVDATLGRAGHARELLSAHPGLSLIGIDTDAAAIAESRRILLPFADRIMLVQAVYDELPQILADLGRPGVQGVLFDLGVSSPQLDNPSRGFSYSKDAPLDMRMDQAGPLTAADVLNTYPAARLARVLRDYGEERFARQIADAVVRERARAPLTSTLRLAEIVRDSISVRSRRCASRSMASWTRCTVPCRPRSTRSPSAAGSSPSPITRWRTALSSARWRSARPTRPRPACRYRLSRRGRSSGC